MEQDNKTMSAAELIRYIEDNNLELQMLDILLFNDCGFEFVPVYKPRLSMSGKEKMDCSLLDYEDLNILSSDYQLPSFKLPVERLPENWNRYVNHPEHLYAYISRYDNLVKGEFFYSRSPNAYAQVRNDAFEDFVEYSGMSSIKDFRKLARKAAKRRNEQYSDVLIYKKYENYWELLFDEKLFDSITCNGENTFTIGNSYCSRMYETENAIYHNRYISVDNMLFIPDVTESTISFSVKFIPLPENKTSVDQDISIVDPDDKISDILYQIAVKIGANAFLAATGYAYDSGIRMLEPAIKCTRGTNRPYDIELVIGDLQDYRPDVKQKSLNRKTAEKINWLKDCCSRSRLYTCPDSFYHGKFYYISNGKVSYVIVGSSNITESAYTKNRELDVMFRFERGEDGQPCEQEQMFLDWYADLKKKCVEIPRLDETLFSSNLIIDEAGNSSSSSILKKLTSEEEKERYRFLESLCPSSVDEKMFYKKKEFKAFKGYIAFYYPENNITVLESFQYGNSCFVFGTTDEERIRMALARKSKEQVKQGDIYISNVNHDEDYQSELHQIFGK